MNTWNLDILYKGFDDPAFEADYAIFEQQIERLKSYLSAFASDRHDATVLEAYLKDTIDLEVLVDKLIHFASLRSSTDSTDSVAQKTMNRLQTAMTRLTDSNTRFRKWLARYPNLDHDITGNPFLNEHRFYLKERVDEAKRMKDEATETLIAKLRQTGSTAWGRLQSLLTSTLSVEYRGTTVTLSEVRNLAYDKDPSVRKDAYHAELAAYAKIEPSIAFALNAIKGEVNVLSELRGFPSPLHQALDSSRLSEETLTALLSAMREFLPVFRQYLKRKAQMLGHQNGLPFYDLFAPIGAMTRTYTIEEANQVILKNFATFSPRLHAMAQRAFAEGWIDYLPKKGKVGGAFCANMPSIKQSRVLTNFDGSFGDIITIAHELGHAYHGEAIFAESILNTDYTMPVAETASIFCETIVKEAALLDAVDSNERLGILEASLQDSTQVIVDILSRFQFEKAVFDGRKTTLFDEGELKQMMLEAQMATYGDGLDASLLHPYMWVCKSHYYRGGLSFYNFPYAYGLLFARGLYAQYLKNPDGFVPAYDALLSSTGKMSCEDVAKLAGIDVTQSAFWRQSLQGIQKDVERFLAWTEENRQ
jgi:pepF/M3 family oligoendopeptidase